MTGTGTSNDPYLCSTWGDLMTALPQEGKYAELIADLDMRGVNITDRNILLACNFNGNGHVIKNAYLNSGILFKLQYDITFENIKFYNWYLNGATLFNGDSAHPMYYPMPTLSDISFSGELEGSTFISGDWRNQKPTLKNCDAYGLLKSGRIVDALSYPPLLDSCTIEMHGECDQYIFSGRLSDTQIIGSIKLTNITAGYYSLYIDNQDLYSSVINIEVEADTTWTAYAVGNRTLLNTDNLENADLTDVSCITCTTAQMNDAEWLEDHGFPLGETPTDFVWADFLSYVQQVVRTPENSVQPHSISNNVLTITNNEVEPTRGEYTEPFWGYQGYRWYFTYGQKYVVHIDADSTEQLSAIIILWLDGTTYKTAYFAPDAIFQINDYSEFITFQVGFYNKDSENANGVLSIRDVTINEVSMWSVVNGKLVNTSLPTPTPIGAFYGAYALTSIEIPVSVKKIGKWAFAGTNLTDVTIASDCDYYDTSFPIGCAVHFYD